MTRLSVPTSSVNAMPTDTWNSDRRSSRGSGRSGVAASANGRKRGPMRAQREIRLRLMRFMAGSSKTIVAAAAMQMKSTDHERRRQAGELPAGCARARVGAATPRGYFVAAAAATSVVGGAAASPPGASIDAVFFMPPS